MCSAASWSKVMPATSRSRVRITGTIPKIAACVVTAVAERLVVALATAEAALLGDAKCLVELRGFEPLTPCMPCKCSAS